MFLLIFCQMEKVPRSNSWNKWIKQNTLKFQVCNNKFYHKDKWIQFFLEFDTNNCISSLFGKFWFPYAQRRANKVEWLLVIKTIVFACTTRSGWDKRKICKYYSMGKTILGIKSPSRAILGMPMNIKWRIPKD